MESEDYSFYSGLHYILGHNISDLGYDLTFATEVSLCTLFFSGGGYTSSPPYPMPFLFCSRVLSSWPYLHVDMDVTYQLIYLIIKLI